MARGKTRVDAKLGPVLRAKCTVGESKNYNFQGSDYTFWPFGTIEQLPDDEHYKYKARAIVADSSDDMVVFNSFHQDYADAERAIAVVREALTADGPLYNIFAETLESHSSDLGGGKIVNTCETLALIWSFNYPT
jgi:hypothetical protein